MFESYSIFDSYSPIISSVFFPSTVTYSYAHNSFDFFGAFKNGSCSWNGAFGTSSDFGCPFIVIPDRDSFIVVPDIEL